LDAPPVNAMSNALLEALAAAIEQADADDAIRAIVVTGTGDKAFAAGADLPEFEQVMRSDESVLEHTDFTRRALGAIEGSGKPVIAAVQASAVGGGLELVLACDLVVADEGAKLGLPEVRLGLIPGAGGTQRLTRRIGYARAADMILRGALLSAERAAEIGIVTEVAPAGTALDRALELAGKMAAFSGPALGAAKRAMRQGLETSLQQGLDLERAEFRKILQTPEAREGVRAFIERRPPQFAAAAPKRGQ
jgi:enoyl-CoA hydratase/carnithine racemase